MLNSNKISEIKIILEGLLKDVDNLSENEMVSHIKWEEILMSASMISHKLNTLRIEQERNFMKRYLLREEASQLTQSVSEIKRAISELRINISASELPKAYTQSTHIQDKQLFEPEPPKSVPVVEEEIDYDFLMNNTSAKEEQGQLPSWMRDMPGPAVNDLHMAVTLNDKLYFIKELFKGDEDQFRLSIQRLNEMNSLKEALEYTRAAFPEWDEDSDSIYRFYMLLRRRYNG